MPESKDDVLHESKEKTGVEDADKTIVSEEDNTEKDTDRDDIVETITEKPVLLEDTKKEFGEITSETLHHGLGDNKREAKADEYDQIGESSHKESPKPLSNEEVTDYTASLWKYLPIPSDEPDSFPEYINGTLEYSGCKIIAARVRGKKHKHEGTNCDDWYEVANYGNITFVAVSDGAGSKKFSRIGARDSCKVAVGYLVSNFENTFTTQPELRNDLNLPFSDPKCMEACAKVARIVQEAVVQSREAVETAFYSRKTDPKYEGVLGRELRFADFSGTLLLTVLIPVSDEKKEYLVFSCQIGDGMIAVVNSEAEFDNSVKLMGVADSGDFSGETDFLTSLQMKNIENLQLRTKISRTVIDTVLVMSDGVADDYYPNETQMIRLYYDLVINGILDIDSSPISLATLTPEQMKLFKRIPDPQVYPWVNDQTIKIPIQYTRGILESTGLSLEDLWKDRTILSLARLELVEDGNSCDPSVKLKVWLDNYVERGSFDDRTLVIVTL